MRYITMIDPHLPTQASEHVIPFLNFTPQWFIDCGPGSGVEAREVREKWPEVNILSLEPSPIGFEAAISLFPIGGGRLLKVGVWDFDCELDLSKSNDLLHSTFANRDLDPPGETIKASVRSLDSLDQQYGPFNDALLWMDIEGSEEKALLGAKGLLERKAIKGINLEVNGKTGTLLGSILSSYGFSKLRTYFDQGNGGSRDELWLLKQAVIK